eukprot:TRINITY_DN30633_c0_g1_i1.p1 TRINITY_DN30633_c0_g1~~TRINITY_DN30633_c0_g1_i1.p1  ORF type:complete len:655 (+),score=41.42 TRINITY_DN30633_c0_g1_i1:52-2016(+)
MQEHRPARVPRSPGHEFVRHDTPTTTGGVGGGRVAPVGASRMSDPRRTPDVGLSPKPEARPISAGRVPVTSDWRTGEMRAPSETIERDRLHREDRERARLEREKTERERERERARAERERAREWDRDRLTDRLDQGLHHREDVRGDARVSHSTVDAGRRKTSNKSPQRREPPTLEIGLKGYYEGKDVNLTYWPITLTSYDAATGMYSADVHDGTAGGKVWPKVHPANVRVSDPSGPRTPLGISRKGQVITVERGRVDFRAPGRGQVSFFPSGTGRTCSFREREAPKPDFIKAHLQKTPTPCLILSCVVCGHPGCHSDHSVPCAGCAKIVELPQDEHSAAALIAPLRRVFMGACIEHNLGHEPPATVGPWERKRSSTMNGLTYWYNSETKVSQWQEPPRDDVEFALAIAQSHDDYKQKTGLEQARTAEEAEKERKGLAENLQAAGLKEVPVHADGHCQFRAIAFHVFGDPDRHKEVRKSVVEYMRLPEQVERFKAFVSKHDDQSQEAAYAEYLDRMEVTDRKSGPEWGDHQTLKAAADLYGLVVRIVTSSQNTSGKQAQLVSTADPQPDDHSEAASFGQKQIWMSYLNEPGAQHYNPCVPDGSSSRAASPLRSTDPSIVTVSGHSGAASEPCTPARSPAQAASPQPPASQGRRTT